MLSFQEIIFSLQRYWADHGCCIMQPIDIEVGAGTFHPYTFLKALGPEPCSFAYVQPSRRPVDGRYGKNPGRIQHYYQFQVMIKPSPINLQELFLQSLKVLGVDSLINDIRFIEDNWRSPTLGSWGYGWEIWLNSLEITQFTYFQKVGGFDCNPITGEITYGLERLAMHLQNVDSVYDIIWSISDNHTVYYRDIFHQNEVEMSEYNFKEADINYLLKGFNFYISESLRVLEKKLVLPSYELMLKSSHFFNLLDARHAISVEERQRYILKMGNLSKNIAKSYLDYRSSLGFPFLTK